MSKLRLLALLSVAAITLAPGCDSKAVGIDECTKIEQARCSAARACELGIDSDDAQAECERFARDDCMHGLAAATAPKATELDRCVALIEGAGACATRKGGKTLASACGLKGTVSPSDTTACELVQNPEESSECLFLIPTPPEESPPATTSDGAAGAGSDAG